MLTAKTFPTPRIGKPRKSCPICAASASSRSTPRRGTRGCSADRGSSWPWRDGHVCGISVAWRADGEMRAIYIPLRHPDTDNFDPAQVYRWLKDLVASDVAHRHA